MEEISRERGTLLLRQIQREFFDLDNAHLSKNTRVLSIDQPLNTLLLAIRRRPVNA